MTSLNIAIVVRLFSPSGGLELYALRLVQGLLQRGHRVTVICQTDESGLSHHNLTIKTFDQAPRGISKSARLVHIYNAASALLASSGPFDLVHSQHCPVKGADLVTFHQHTAKRFSFSGYPAERLINEYKLATNDAYKTRMQQDGDLAKSTKMRIFVSQICKRDYYETYNLDDAPYAIAPCGADSQSEYDISQKVQAQPFNYLFIGKGYRKKGLDTLYTACALLKKQGLKFKLTVVGLRASLFNKLTAGMHGIADCVEFAGYQKDLKPFQENASVIVVPSKCEAFCMSPVEAMLFGVPAIVSSVVGVSELLNDGIDGLVLKDHLSAKELAQHMQQLQSDPAMLKSMQIKARAKAKQLTWDKTVDATITAYQKLLKSEVGTNENR
ncbi:MAG: glycosyltransferase family 4 protein [Candidatus Obscuribacter sp.]|nr:glycosyltransferase family 4 protein [Candidatus Obscuribacter sp.]